MARILLAVDFDVEERLLEGVIVSGHEIVDRVAGADALVQAVAGLRPDLVIVQAGPETLNARSLAACDAAGSRAIALTADDLERRNALSLGVVDRMDARSEWVDIEAVALRTRREPEASPPGGESGEGLGVPDPAGPGPARLRSRRERRAEERCGRVRRAAPEDAAPVPGAPALDAPGPARRRPGRPRPFAALGRRSGEVPAAGAAEAPQDPVPQEEGSGRGRVLAVWGPHGAPGRTTVALALATVLVGEGIGTTLLDADPYGGAIAPLLGIADEAPGLAAACRLAGAEALDAIEFDRVASRAKTPTGELRVLSGIANPARWPELGGARMRGVLERARHEAAATVVDTGFSLERDEELLSDMAGPRRNAATHAALADCDAAIAVADATPLGIQRFLRAYPQLLDAVGPGTRILVVANRVRGAVTGVDSGAQIRQALRRFGGIERVALLPHEPKAADRALGEAASLTDVAPRSRFARQLRALAVEAMDARPRGAAQLSDTVS
ncbi:hypothetical protein [Gulosibacter sp. 10]|uniref:AAA family ATPase n=1 Tax=Gulosibacter sp. 10 TaxID=1255570 RepID=UPI00097EF4C4|nr:hypothetical protein [Gulosibacter sp. 10]SJM54492.1 Type II/IV secretion system ATPase TadZ/CpaE, associated with Flp pilus assembly [Gulosibacter sp. 10]